MTRHHFGNDSRVAALLSLRKVEGVSTRQSVARRLKGYNLIDAASVGLWIVG